MVLSPLPASLNLPRTLDKSIQSGQALPVPFVFLGRQPTKYLQSFEKSANPNCLTLEAKTDRKTTDVEPGGLRAPSLGAGEELERKAKARRQGYTNMDAYHMMESVSPQKGRWPACTGLGLLFLLLPLKSRSMVSPHTGSVRILTRGLDSEEMKRKMRSNCFFQKLSSFMSPRILICSFPVYTVFLVCRRLA